MLEPPLLSALHPLTLRKLAFDTDIACHYATTTGTMEIMIWYGCPGVVGSDE
jgi:hypothetical protein